MAPKELNALRHTEALKRAEEVFRMSAILKMNQYEIAASLGISQPAVSKILDRGVKERLKQNSELAEGALAVAEAQHADRYQRLLGLLRPEAKGQPSKLKAEVQAQIIEGLRKESDHYCKLYGLYAPEKKEVSGPNGGPISVSNDSDLLSQLRNMTPKARAFLAGFAQEVGVAIEAAIEPALTDGGSEATEEGDE